MSSSVIRSFSSSPRRYLALLALPLAGALWAHGRPGPAASARAARASASAPEPAPRRTRCGFSPGERVSYELTFEEAGEMDARKLLPRGATGAATRMDLRVTGALHLVGLSVDQGTSLVAGRFEGVRLADRSSGRAGALEGAERPLLFRMNERCGIEALARHRDTGAEGARRQQGLLLALEALLPVEGERVYEAEQRDATGVFRARYGQGVVGGRARVERRILGYERLWSGGQGKVASSHAEIEPGDGPWFERLREETRVALAAEGAPLGSLRVQKEAHRVAQPAGAIDAAAIQLDAFVWGDALVPPPTEAPDDPQAAALTPEQAVARLDELLRGPGTSLGKAMRLLESFLRAHPGQSEALLREARRSDQHLSLTLAALGQVGGEAAERALLGVTRDRGWKDGDRVRSAAALATMKGASARAAEALAAAARRGGKDELGGGAALLALGAMAGQRSVAAPEAAGLARAEVRRALAEAHGPGEVARALAAAGNAGLPEFLPEIERGLADPEASVRAQAAQAMRGYTPERVAATLTARLAVEPEASVRLAALDATSEQLDRPGAALPGDAVEALLARLPQEGDAAARAALVRLLGAAAGARPEVRAALVAQFRRESDPSVLRALGAVVHAGEL